MKETIVVFLKHINGRAYVKWNKDGVGYELFNEGVIDEVGKKGHWHKTETEESEFMLHQMKFKIICED